MSKKHKIIAWAAVGLGLLALLAWYLHQHFVAVLQPRGTISYQERNLIFIALLLAVLVVVPVYVMTATIAWKYRATNTKAHYTPDWDGNRAIELTWWAIPGVIILILSVITWNSSHSLDPFRSLSSTKTPMTVQVVSLDWKWLFIYPKQQIASVNFFELPVNTPVNFDLTSDSVMNSFWVPALGSQIYTMPGMNTQVHLMATQAGSYHGSSANISGVGFAGMVFTAKAASQAAFNEWVSQTQQSTNWLNLTSYSNLAKPSQNSPTIVYSHADSSLYDYVINRYMAPGIGLQSHGGHEVSGVATQ